MSNWFYAGKNKERSGPVKESELLRLNEAGELKGTDLVWRSGMEKWAPLYQVAGEIFARLQAPPDRDEMVPLRPVEVGICAHSDRVLPREEMVPYGDALIAAEHKDAFVQGLMESGDTDVIDPEEFVYIGFWWRLLGHLIDSLIKGTVGIIGFIPYFITIARVNPDTAEPDEMIPVFVALGFGGLVTLCISIYYHTWMVGKYGGEVGKIVIGARIVTTDGEPLSHGRAFLRWLGKIVLSTFLIQYVIPYVLVVLLMVLFFSASFVSDDPSLMMGSFFLILFIFPVVVGVFSFVFWMCAFDPEKRTLHDRICSTRVIRKNQS